MFRSMLNLALLVSLAVPALAESIPDTASRALADNPALFSSDGFRQDRYRSPTPEAAPGATTIDTPGLQAMLAEHPDLVLIDVINAEYRHDRFLQDEPHHTIPQAHWLPNTGKGQIDALWKNYLLDNLARLTGDRPDQPVVVFCKSDCWLSWNAVKRITEAGYSHVYWYKDGIDSWMGAGLPTRIADPVKPTHS